MDTRKKCKDAVGKSQQPESTQTASELVNGVVDQLVEAQVDLDSVSLREMKSLLARASRQRSATLSNQNAC